MGVPYGGFGDRNESWTPIAPRDWRYEEELLYPLGRPKRENDEEPQWDDTNQEETKDGKQPKTKP